ncbi:hypothetical protein CAV_0592 [Campylobacter avium LMG 24591]|uniref:Uncharacterized protein n=1 Tax=Campylobacter avium LMG 24591 TaxID=522484 RepID=A0A222MWH8_9BACT|nr:hypothetical protein [Campylobacter avium]ASQ30259.1 hypothetical protein CAV_0592 [Campylobacter avium LMG 24591]OYD79357.1 hypothetical protein CAV8706_0594 [Campylobacter avium]
MKVKELTKFDKTLKERFCNYLKKYFKEDCEVTWVFDDKISIDIDFEVVDEKEHAYLRITDGESYKIYLNELSSNINILDFKKYIDKFLNEEYKKKDYINTRDFKKICALYDSLGVKYKKDDIKEFYKAIASVLSKDRKPYILDSKKIFAYSNKRCAQQDIYSDGETLTFAVHLWNDLRIIKTSFDVNYEQINILTLAQELVNMQKKLEEIIK